MKKQRFTESQIMQILKQAEGGIPVADLCREYGMSNASFYKWRSKYGGMDVAMLSEMKTNKSSGSNGVWSFNYKPGSFEFFHAGQQTIKFIRL